MKILRSLLYPFQRAVPSRAPVRMATLSWGVAVVTIFATCGSTGSASAADAPAVVNSLPVTTSAPAAPVAVDRDALRKKAKERRMQERASEERTVPRPSSEQSHPAGI